MQRIRIIVRPGLLSVISTIANMAYERCFVRLNVITHTTAHANFVNQSQLLPKFNYEVSQQTYLLLFYILGLKNYAVIIFRRI